MLQLLISLHRNKIAMIKYTVAIMNIHQYENSHVAVCLHLNAAVAQLLCRCGAQADTLRASRQKVGQCRAPQRASLHVWMLWPRHAYEGSNSGAVRHVREKLTAI